MKLEFLNVRKTICTSTFVPASIGGGVLTGFGNFMAPVYSPSVYGVDLCIVNSLRSAIIACAEAIEDDVDNQQQLHRLQ